MALYTLPAGIPGQSSAPVKNSAHHHARLYGSTIYNNNVTPAQNVETFTGAAVTLPTSPSTYYLGLVIDPNNTLKQLSLPANRLELIRTVGPATSGLPPAGVVSTTPLSPYRSSRTRPTGSRSATSTQLHIPFRPERG